MLIACFVMPGCAIVVATQVCATKMPTLLPVSSMCLIKVAAHRVIVGTESQRDKLLETLCKGLLVTIGACA